MGVNSLSLHEQGNKKMTNRVKVAAACVPDVKGDRDANLAAALSLIGRLAGQGAQIVVLPEVCLQGYPLENSILSEAQMRGIAEPYDGLYVNAFRKAAKEHDIYLVAAYDRLDGSDIYNTAELISPEGKTLGLYDKTHTGCPPENRYYTPGKSLPVFDTEFGKIGILICIDRTYAENWRVLMLKGARLVLIPSNGGYSEMNTHRLQTRAFDQCLCNVFAHPKRGLVIDVSGKIVDRDRDSAKPYAFGEFDLSEIGPRQEHLRQRRRPDLYEAVLHR